MALETGATYISQLNSSNPASSDGLYQADDHMRLIKATLLATFPNFTAAALTSTQANIDAAVAAVVTNLGYVKPGFIQDYAGTSAPTGWLECTGAAVSRTTYAALFTAIGTTWGAGDGSTTFNLPGDRYRVGRNTAAAAVGTLQASQNKTHTHTGSGTTGNDSPDHTHDMTHTTGNSNQSLNHAHSFTQAVASGLVGPVTAGAGSWPSYGSGATTGAADLTGHNHSFSGSTGGRSAFHQHGFSVTTGNGSADGTDARPLSAVYLTCIKT
jgi:microcystin-dependent protein